MSTPFASLRAGRQSTSVNGIQSVKCSQSGGCGNFGPQREADDDKADGQHDEDCGPVGSVGP